MISLLIGVVLAFFITTPSPSWAQASDRSVVAFSRGIELFRAGRFDEARTQFEQAVEADPGSIEALYYRGVTRGRAGAWREAIEDLTVVVTARPAFRQATLELGIAYVGAEEPAEALTFLEQALSVPELSSSASFFLGLAYWRLNAPGYAQSYFARAAQTEEHRVAARYYLGLIAFDASEFAEASAHFEYVVATNPGSEMATEAQVFLTRLQSLTKRYQLYGEIGIEYDSNVVLAPSDQDAQDELAISNEDDGRVNILAGGRYIPWRTNEMELSLGYEFYQGLQFDLTEFNLQDHRPSIHFAFTDEAVSAGILGRYDYYRLDTDSLLNQGVVLPWVRVATGSIGYAELSYRMRVQDYIDERFAPRLDAINHAAGVRQVVYLGTPQRELYLGYRFDRQEALHASGNPFAYDGNQAEAGLRWTAAQDWASAELSYRFRHEDYDSASQGRRDDEHGVYFACRKRLHRILALRLSYFGTFNGSTEPVFEYDRHVVGLATEVSF